MYQRVGDDVDISPSRKKCVISLADAGMMVEVNIFCDFKYVVYKFISHLNPFDLKDAVIAPLDVTVSTSTCRKPAAVSVVPGAPHFHLAEPGGISV